MSAPQLIQPGLFDVEQRGPVIPATENAMGPLLYFYRRWYQRRPRREWPVSDRRIGPEGFPVTPYSMFAALNFTIATCLAIQLKERADFPPPRLRLIERGSTNSLTRFAHPEDIFTVSVRWVMQCLVTKTRCPYHGGQSLHANLTAITNGDYEPGNGIDAVLPAEWIMLFLPLGFDMLQEAVDEAFEFDWFHDRQERPPEGAIDTGEWYDPLGRYYETRILGNGG